jgi:hypothetical protein
MAMSREFTPLVFPDGKESQRVCRIRPFTSGLADITGVNRSGHHQGVFASTIRVRFRALPTVFCRVE